MKEKNLEEAISYFRKYTVYTKVFAAMRKKYAARGQLCGTLTLEKLTGEERSTLSGFTGVDLGKEETVQFSFLALNRALKKSRFHELEWEEILEGYDGKPLVSNKEEKQRREEAKDGFKEECLAFCASGDVRTWLSGLLYEKRNGYRLVERLLESDREELKQLLKNVVFGLEHLPVDEGKKEVLPVYAAEITGNPHYFDDGTAACRLLLNYGEYRFGTTEDKESGAERRETILYKLGILIDDLSNMCLAYGVSGRKPDGSVHEGLHGFCTEKQAFQVTLNTLGSLSCLEAAGNGKKAVYVIENPAVFSYLTKKYPGDTFLCTAGQIKLAGYVAMDLFPEKYVFYYAGDFDPEGLQIAQKLKKRYGKRLFFWNYKREYYEQAVSGAVMDTPRLNKLEKVETAELDEIKDCLLTHKRAAYQERMMDWYIVE